MISYKLLKSLLKELSRKNVLVFLFSFKNYTKQHILKSNLRLEDNLMSSVRIQTSRGSNVKVKKAPWLQ